MAPRRASASAVAFVFDIDGVLLHSKSPLPTARAALAAVTAAHAPVAFLTNGGGVTESAKARELEELLGSPVAENQVILAHTPFRSLAPSFAARPVLAVGRRETVAVASGYGFNAVSPASVAAAHPHATPLAPARSGAPPPLPPPGVGTSANPFAAIFCFADPACMSTDLQIAIDVLVGGGDLHARRSRTHPPLFFSNPDLLWANAHPTPRLGQAAFRAALEAVYERVAGRPLDADRVTTVGKPTRAPYDLARSALASHASRLGVPMPARIVAVGDNPYADVAGARAAGGGFEPVLVLTGVAERDSTVHPADRVCADVGEAVAWGLAGG